MRILRLSALALVLGSTSGLMAQDPHLGFGINLGFPTGDFRSKTYPPNAEVQAEQTDGHDVGIGGQMTISFPVDPTFAIRMNFNIMSTNGTNTAAGYNDLTLKHELFGIGGDMQFFLNGGALRHRGTYLLLGASADFERFDRSEGSNWDWWSDTPTDTTRKSRLAGTAGIGHSFGYGGGTRFSLEVTFHKTLTGNDIMKKEPPSADFMKVSFGWVF
ncbi:MAG: hypothetical protein IPQ13_13660 [Holophagaceae bacterium]|nr:hypothetical protein [Holophagaceae bacterium]